MVLADDFDLNGLSLRELQFTEMLHELVLVKQLFWVLKAIFYRNVWLVVSLYVIPEGGERLMYG